MWFKRRTAKRNAGREQSRADKAGSNQSLAWRWRMVTTAFAAAVAVALGFFLIYQSVAWIKRYCFLENERLVIHNLDIRTDGLLLIEKIRQWAGVKTGDFMMQVDLMRIQNTLETNPIIKSVAIERILPHTLRINISEREPVALTCLVLPQPTGSLLVTNYFYLDPDGYIMPPMPPEIRNPQIQFHGDQFTWIQGLQVSNFKYGAPIVMPQLTAALHLVDLFESSPMFGIVDLARIEVDSPGVIKVHTSQNNVVIMALENLPDQLRRWRSVYDYGKRDGKSIATLDLSVSNNLPVVWSEPGTPPPPQPKNIRIRRYRR